MLQCTYGNGLIDSRNYDLQGRLVNQALTDPLTTILDTRTVDYDQNSNIVGIDTDTEDNLYLYDKLDRLTSDEVVGLPINDYTYDLNDNRGTRVLNDASQDEDYFYTEDTNQVNAQEAFLATGATLPVNPNRALFYNDVGRLYKLHEDGTRKAAFLYNDAGQRTRKTTYLADGITIQSETIYHYDAMGYLTTETQTNGTLIRDYIW